MLRTLGIETSCDESAVAVLDHDGSVTYFRDAVLNYPTLAEAYKVAALDGLYKLS